VVVSDGLKTCRNGRFSVIVGVWAFAGFCRVRYNGQQALERDAPLLSLYNLLHNLYITLPFIVEGQDTLSWPVPSLLPFERASLWQRLKRSEIE
jgi:hypothetical protein